MPSLQQRLIQNPPTARGIHEGMALHAEDIFNEFQGILPVFLGKRARGPFVTLTLPKPVTESSEALLSCLADLIAAYEFSLISFVSAARAQAEANGDSKLGALLITADNASSLFQLPWRLDFDADANLTGHSRSEADGEIVPRDTWRAFFEQSPGPAERQTAYNNLIMIFGDPAALPEFSL